MFTFIYHLYSDKKTIIDIKLYKSLEERANLSAVRTFVRFALVWFCLFSLLFGVWEGLRFVIVALPGCFLLPLFVINFISELSNENNTQQHSS